MKVEKLTPDMWIKCDAIVAVNARKYRVGHKDDQCEFRATFAIGPQRLCHRHAGATLLQRALERGHDGDGL